MYKEKYFLQAMWNNSLGLAKPSLSTESSFGPRISKKNWSIREILQGSNQMSNNHNLQKEADLLFIGEKRLKLEYKNGLQY